MGVTKVRNKEEFAAALKANNIEFKTTDIRSNFCGIRFTFKDRRTGNKALKVAGQEPTLSGGWTLRKLTGNPEVFVDLY